MQKRKEKKIGTHGPVMLVCNVIASIVVLHVSKRIGSLESMFMVVNRRNRGSENHQLR